MEQFSHDLTLALEETSRVRAGHCWGGRRRTRSTGNLRKFNAINAHVSNNRSQTFYSIPYCNARTAH